MGTFVTVTVPHADADQLAAFTRVAQSHVRELDAMLSTYKPDSDISRLNRATAGTPVPVAPHTRRVLELALAFAKETGGCFDPTVGPLVRLWGFNGGTTPDTPIAPSILRTVLAQTGYGRLSLSNDTARLEPAPSDGDTRIPSQPPTVHVDLGGIAKGYAVDICFQDAEALGLRRAMVNIGGNIRCIGSTDKGPWKIGVRNPFDTGQLMGVISLPPGMAVATSGNYERFVSIAGKRYAHIIDPRTGYPVEGMAGVTVLAPTATDADAMSTTLFVLGAEAGAQWLTRRPDCHALFVPDQQPAKIRITPGFRRYFQPLPPFANAVELLDD